jgi:IgA peptidase M64
VPVEKSSGSFVMVVDNGPSAIRWDMVLMGDGYQEDQMDQYAADVQRFVDIMFQTPPFDEMRPAINVHRVDVSSTDSGADDPTDCEEGSGATARTYFDATFCTDNLHRLLGVNVDTALATVNDQVPQWNVVLVVVNSTVHGGAGGPVGTFSLARDAEEIALHELGHTAFGLADEYDSLRGCPDPMATPPVTDPGHDTYTGGEPAEVNVTIYTDRATLKWGQLVAATTPIPTMRNPDCTRCDRRPSPVPAGTVGLFEGAHTFRCGVFRPEFDCKMRTLGEPFCAVCQERIRTVLAPFLRDFVSTATGRVKLLRVHRVLGFGPPHDHIPVHVVTQLDSEPNKFLGFPLRDDQDRPVHQEWLDDLRIAFSSGRQVSIESGFTGGNNEVIRHIRLLT